MVIYYLFKFQYATGICLLLENVGVSEQQQETPQFISADVWPPNSPDLNPVDYRIWGWMQEHVYTVQYARPRHQRLEEAPH